MKGVGWGWGPIISKQTFNKGRDYDGDYEGASVVDLGKGGRD